MFRNEELANGANEVWGRELANLTNSQRKDKVEAVEALAPPTVTPDAMEKINQGSLNPNHDWGDKYTPYKVPKGSSKVGGYRVYASPYALPHTYWIVNRAKWEEEYRLAKEEAKINKGDAPKKFNFMIEYPYTEYFWLSSYYIYEVVPPSALPLSMGEHSAGVFTEQRAALPKKGGQRRIKYLAFKSSAYDPAKNHTYDYYVATELNKIIPDAQYMFELPSKEKATKEEILRTSSSYYDLYNYFINIGKQKKKVYLPLGQSYMAPGGVIEPRTEVTPHDIRTGNYDPGLWKEFEDELKKIAKDLEVFTLDLLDEGLEIIGKGISALIDFILDNPVVLLLLVGGGYLAYEYATHK